MPVADPSSETPNADVTDGVDKGNPTTSSTTDASAVSSTATETAAKPADGEKPAGGEGGGDATKPKSVFEAVKAGLNKDKGADPSSADAKQVQPNQPKDKAGADGQPAKPGEKPEGAKPEVPTEFSKHPAWIRIAKDRDQARSELDTAKDGAEKWTRFNELVKSTGFGTTEAADAWMNMGARWNKAGVTEDERMVMSEIAIATRTDPARALKIITPIYDALRGIVGEGSLPADLQAQVDAGELTEEHARRIVRADADKRLAEGRANRESDAARQEREAREAQAAGEKMFQAVFSWETKQAGSDPDWQRIAPLVNEQIGILRDARKPRTAEDAVKVCDDALAIVKRTIGAVVPPKPAVTPPSTPTANRQPQARAPSLLEHVKRSLAA